MMEQENKKPSLTWHDTAAAKEAKIIGDKLKHEGLMQEVYKPTIIPATQTQGRSI